MASLQSKFDRVNNPAGVSTVDQLFRSAIAACLNCGEKVESRVGGAKEIVGWSCRMQNPRHNLLTNPTRKLRRFYAVAELLWYLSGVQEIRWLTPYAPRYKEFSNDGINAYGAYGPRGLSLGHLQMLADILSELPSSRQAVLSFWKPGDLQIVRQQASKDIPCTLSLQFLLRRGRLNCIATMRSNDVWLGLPYDVFCFTSIQQIIAAELGVELGWYQHQVGSLHVYDNNRSKCEQSLSAPYTLSEEPFPKEAAAPPPFVVLRAMISGWMKGTRQPNDTPQTFEEPYQSMLNCCAHRLNPEMPEPIVACWQELFQREDKPSV